jgi:hypothetical protein
MRRSRSTSPRTGRALRETHLDEPGAALRLADAFALGRRLFGDLPLGGTAA